jgi:hypothetical protein
VVVAAMPPLSNIQRAHATIALMRTMYWRTLRFRGADGIDERSAQHGAAVLFFICRGSSPSSGPA